MKKIIVLILSLFVYVPYIFCQSSDIKKIQSLTQEAIKKAYPASIRMWAFDTVKMQQAGPQFSAVVVTREGHILTAAHVNTPGQTYMVTFPDGVSCIAVGLGEIELAETPMMPDVAMMKIKTKGVWPFAEMGWSSAVKVNDPMISISYPETLNQKIPLVRFGNVTNVLNKYGFLQSTCRMEPGDSGGPLFDRHGRVIGLHSAINVDVDYEVPVDLYRKYWNALHEARTYTAYPPQEVLIEPNLVIDSVAALGFPTLNSRSRKFNKTIERFANHVVSINSSLTDSIQPILGTLVKSGKATYIVSKSSMIGADPVALLDNGKRISLRTIYRDKNTDLVLLQPVSKVSGGISLPSFVKDTINKDQLGTLLISALKPAEDSEVSVLGSTNFSLNKVAGMAYLGAAVAYKSPVAITVVQPGSPADIAGLKVGDQLVRIDDAAIIKPEDYGNQLMKYWAGDTIMFDITREGSLHSNQITLASRPERPATHPADMFAGGKSKRRDGFDAIFAHGANIKPNQCGGPVFDQNGRFYGINIARFSRTSTIVVSAQAISTFIRSALTAIQHP